MADEDGGDDEKVDVVDEREISVGTIVKADVENAEGDEDAEPKAKQTPAEYFGAVMHAMFMQKPVLAMLHIFLPPALWWQYTTAPDDDYNNCLLFLFSLLALVPQAERLGYVTEQLSLHLGQTMAGLIHVTWRRCASVASPAWRWL